MTDWERAACRGEDTEAWFTNGPPSAHVLRLCRGCPVRDACLDEAMRIEDVRSEYHRHGVFGGLTGPERAALARMRRKASA